MRRVLWGFTFRSGAAVFPEVRENLRPIRVLPMRLFLPFLIAAAAAVSGSPQANLLLEGNFAGGSIGGPPPAPWIVSQSRPGVGVALERLPGSDDQRLWARFLDDSAESAVLLTQSFDGINSGRLTLSLHLEKFGAAVWFLLGRQNLASREDMLFTFKVTTKGGFLAATPQGKIADVSGSKSFAFAPGQTYNLYCNFQPTADQSKLKIEIGEINRGVIFRGTMDRAEPVTTFSIRTHGEDAGSDFFVTDMFLTGSP